jgi:monoamine oxidase
LDYWLIDTLDWRVVDANIRTSTPVRRNSEDGPRHVSFHISSAETITAQKVIVSVPLRVAVTTMLLPWAPTALINAVRGTPTWMSTHAKAVALYERPFGEMPGYLAGSLAILVHLSRYMIIQESMQACGAYRSCEVAAGTTTK